MFADVDGGVDDDVDATADDDEDVDEEEVEPPNCNLGCRRIPLLFEDVDNIDEDEAVVDIGVNKLS